MTDQKIAIIRIRGEANMKRTIKDTFKMLRLYKKNTCVIIPATKQYVGMVESIKDGITWGEINQETFKLLLEKRGKLPSKGSLTNDYVKEKVKTDINDFVKQYFEGKKDIKDIPGLKPFFKLNPPRGGFERKGVKIAYSLGGALGYRKDKINELLKRMI